MFKPHLATKQPPSLTQEEYLSVIEKHLPLLAQPKMDGVRCLINEKQFPRSRTDKPIPNKWIKKCLRELNLPYGLDGELITVGLNGADCFNDIQSKVSSELGTPQFVYHVFDWFGSELYNKRYDRVCNIISDIIEASYPVKVIASTPCLTIEQVKEMYDYWIKMGYEGICLRSPTSKYKQGRSTLNEGSLFALTPWERSEGEVIGFEEAVEGNNSERGKDELGALVVRDSKFLLDFNVGSGFTHLQRMEIWDKKHLFLGKKITYSYKANRTTKDRPISPIFKGWRNMIDL